MDFCTDCKRLSGVVEDYTAGDKICSECGLVLEERIVFDAERMLSDDDLNNVPVAPEVAAMIQVDLDDEISRLIDSLGDRSPDVSRIKKLVLLVLEMGELQTMTSPRRANLSLINLRMLVSQWYQVSLRHHSLWILLGRFCSNLDLRQEVTKAAREVVHNSEELNLRRLPASIAGAAIYMVTQLSDEKKRLKDIALVTGAAESTIRNVYRDMYPSAARIIPRWFKTDVSALRKPRNLAN